VVKWKQKLGGGFVGSTSVHKQVEEKEASWRLAVSSGPKSRRGDGIRRCRRRGGHKAKKGREIMVLTSVGGSVQNPKGIERKAGTNR